MSQDYTFLHCISSSNLPKCSTFGQGSTVSCRYSHDPNVWQLDTICSHTPLTYPHKPARMAIHPRLGRSLFFFPTVILHLSLLIDLQYSWSPSYGMPPGVIKGFAVRPNKKLSSAGSESRRIANGLTPERSLSHHRSARPIPRPLTWGQVKDYRCICKAFANYTSYLGKGLQVGSERCLTFPHALAPHLPVWTKDQLNGFIWWYAHTRRSPKSDGLKSWGRVQQCIWAVNKFHRRVKGVSIAEDDRQACVTFIQRQSSVLKLRYHTFPRAELTTASVRAMIQATARNELKWSLRQRLDTITLIAILSSTGVRGASILRYGNEFNRQPGSSHDELYSPDVYEAILHTPGGVTFQAPLKDNASSSIPKTRSRSCGITWGDFVFWLSSNGPLVWMQSLDRKTDFGRGKWYPLRSTETLGLSPGCLVILLAWLDGVFGAIPLQKLLDTRNLGDQEFKKLTADPTK